MHFAFAIPCGIVHGSIRGVTQDSDCSSCLRDRFCTFASTRLHLNYFPGNARAVICWANKLPFGKPGLTPGKVGIVAWAPALAVLVEKKSRRMELALYCCCRVRL